MQVLKTIQLRDNPGLTNISTNAQGRYKPIHYTNGRDTSHASASQVGYVSCRSDFELKR